MKPRWPKLGFKSTTTAEIILSGIEMAHMMRKRQATFAYDPDALHCQAVRNPSPHERRVTLNLPLRPQLEFATEPTRRLRNYGFTRTAFSWLAIARRTAIIIPSTVIP